MRVLAAVLAIPVALVAWQWWNDHSTERMLSPVASAVAGHEVTVDCQSLWANLLDAQPRHGEVRFDASGTPEPRILLTHPTCDRLQAFAGRSHHDELECLEITDWAAPIPLPPTSECYRRASPTVYALLTLAHEAYHTAGDTVEATTNCHAIQAMAYVAVALGADARDGVLAADGMMALEPLQSGGYATDRCHAGTELDLHPETRDFPTEYPIAPPGRP